MPRTIWEDSHTGITGGLVEQGGRQMRHRHLRSIPFSYAGVLTLSTSPPWTPHEDCALIEVRALLNTTGTSNTVVTVYVNGTSVGTVTLGSGVANNAATLSTSLTANTDVVTVGITTVGTGSPANLTALLRVA